MDFKPLHNNVMIRMDSVNQDTTMSDGGIYLLPGTLDADQPCKGTVMAVGPGKHNRFGIFVPTVVKVGDTIIYGKPAEVAGTMVTLRQEKYLVIADENILGVLEPLAEGLTKADIVEFVEAVAELPTEVTT